MEKLLSPREEASLGEYLPVEPQLLSDAEIDGVAGGFLNGIQNLNNGGVLPGSGGTVGIGSVNGVGLAVANIGILAL
jgi:hypothetical protein